ECQTTHDKAAMATAAHWQALNGFLARPQRVMRLRDDRNETAGEAALRENDAAPIARTPAAPAPAQMMSEPTLSAAQAPSMPIESDDAAADDVSDAIQLSADATPAATVEAL